MTTETTETAIEIRRSFRAPREKVFAAWTEREALEQWMCRDVPAQDPRYVELDVRAGGQYAIEIPLPGGALYRGFGTFQEVDPPRKLVFTWAWKRIPEKPGELLQTADSLVTVELLDRGGTTEMIFRHELLSSVESRDDHVKGWEGCFVKLAEWLEERFF